MKQKTFVYTDRKDILIQVIRDNEISLHSDDQVWTGGFGIASSWEAISRQKAVKLLKEQKQIPEYIENLLDAFDAI